jgi:hypothetical protein
MSSPYWGYDYEGTQPTMTTITVHPLKQNKRPIGFAPWPKEKKRKKRKK